jgi:hypothetical protein
VWAAEDPALQLIGYEALKAEFEKIKGAYTATGERLLENFLDIAGLL